jgi:peptidoglycan/LPS O-acetylase OafA/YrhL
MPARPGPRFAFMMVRARNTNLDLVRAAAILMVILSHAAVMSPVRRPTALTLAWIGQFGVDLFFVLSGWLIGGLFWKEQTALGGVEWSRFFLRRALRTVPPYLVVLPFAWYAAWRFSPVHPPFDFRYLVFIQNYAPKLPYFAISWSLCVEEHFYLFLPALVLLALARRVSPHVLFAMLLVVSPLCRGFLEHTTTIDDFDRSVLSTHLRLEGLVLGFWAAFIHATDATLWARCARFFPRLFWPAVALLALSPAAPGRLFYVTGFTVLAFVFLIVVGCAAVMPAWRFPGDGVLQRLARISYSVYLTHSLMIHVARNLAPLAGSWAEQAYWPLVLGLMVLAGGAFYRLVEHPCLRTRDRLIPARRMAAVPA